MTLTKYTSPIYLLFLLLIQQGFSQNLDNTYGNGDGITIGVPGIIDRCEMMGDNSVIVQARPLLDKLSKYDADGNQDMTFGANGYVFPFDQTGAQGPTGHSNFIIDPQQRILIGMYEFVNNLHS